MNFQTTSSTPRLIILSLLFMGVSMHVPAFANQPQESNSPAGDVLKLGIEYYDKQKSGQKLSSSESGVLCFMIGLLEGVALTGKGVYWSAPPDDSNDYLIDALRFHLKDHPEDLNASAAVVAGRAFLGTFPAPLPFNNSNVVKAFESARSMPSPTPAKRAHER
jgi:hypothetical protein